MANWIKTTEFGDYRKTPDRVKTSSNECIIRQARSLHIIGKHAGSKPISRLLKGISRAQESIERFKKLREEMSNSSK